MAATTKNTQEFLPIKEVRDNVVILKNNQLVAVLLVSSLNFALKSQDEQIAILLQYQNFLNSLDFHIQIVVQSRRLDIRPYITTLEDRYKEQTNELLRVQTREYIDFIKSFTEAVDIMSKSFFVVVPYSPPVFGRQTSFWTKFLPGGKAKPPSQLGDIFEESRTQLEQRISVVEQGLSRTGVRLAQLGTEELVELFFRIFNPGETEIPTVGAEIAVK